MEDKKQKLEKKINTKISETLDNLENTNKLDYFDIEIKIHQGSIDVRCTTKDREKVY